MNFSFKRTSFQHPLVIFIGLAVLGSLIFSNTLHNEFCSDDLKIIVENNSIKDLGNWTALWKTFNTRILTGWTFALNYRFGRLNVLGYHAGNIVIHVLVSFLVYLFARLTFQTPGMKDSPISRESSLLAALTSLIFLCHPLQTQVVDFTTQRATSLAALLYLLSLVFYVAGRLRRNRCFFLGAVLSMALGIFVKEMMVTLPVTLTLYEIFFFGKPDDRKRFFLRLAPFYILACVVPLTLMADREGSVLGLKAQIIGRSFSWPYFWTEISVLRTYVGMMLFPVHLSHHYSYPVAQGLATPAAAFSAVWLLLLVLFAIWQYPARRLLSFCVAWFFVTLSVEFLHVCFVNKGILYDHWTYLAMVGFSLFLPAVLYYYVRDLRVTTVALAGIIVVCGLLSYQRNTVWKTCVSLWQDVVRQYPRDYLPYVNLGVAESRRGDYDEAVSLYDRALQLYHGSDSKVPAQIYVNLAAVFGRAGDYSREIAFSRQAVRLDPYNAQAYSNLSLAHTLLGDDAKALAYGQKAVATDPGYSDGYNNLGVLFGFQDKLDEAEAYFRKALKVNPDDTTARRNLERAVEMKKNEMKKNKE